MSAADHLLYALLWLGFGALHSVLARDGVKARFGRPRGYRLIYNAVALVHLAAVYGIGRVWLAGDGAPLLSHPAVVGLGWAMTLGGLILGVLALRPYDLGDFSGVSHVRRGAAPDTGALQVQGLNAHMRHPLYSALLLLVWGQANSAFGLATALWASLYILIGSRFEERALMMRFGEAYRRYRARTPAFVPKLRSRKV